MRRKITAFLLSALMILLVGCDDNYSKEVKPLQSSVPASSPVVTESGVENTAEVNEKNDEKIEEESRKEASKAEADKKSDITKEDSEKTTVENTKIPEKAASEGMKIISRSSGFDFSEIPAFSGEPYVVVNNHEPFFTDTTTTEVFELYSPLDEYGRCGVAFANICKELMPTEKRGNIGIIKPSGWKTVKYNGVVEGNYLFNRCHLIAHELAAEDANEKNLITGTRYLNIQGMLQFEEQVKDYVKETDNHVLYRVTPIFEGQNLIASGVLMEGYSVEDAGSGIKYCVYCYNVQPGVEINYANGDSKLTGEKVAEKVKTAAPVVTKAPIVTQAPVLKPTPVVTPAPVKTPTPVVTQTPVVEPEPVQNNTVDYNYVVNTNTEKFHDPGCPSVKLMKDHNRINSSKSRDELIAEGYAPCQRCNP